MLPCKGKGKYYCVFIQMKTKTKETDAHIS